ncbi:hypothetical protein Pla52n_67540 [Stieleria varia]|uniref:Uncharacterized protein n=1 Tax=Stieleria varia TaxID=2528005 RepID=A0A5C5ZQH9_9BACT|nr:hypothetical protein Pla52n_67540 [Stieleria varia]
MGPAYSQCYEQADDECSEYAFGLADHLCNTELCLSEHVFDSMGIAQHQNGFWTMNYDCPPNKYEGIVQSGAFYMCEEFGPDALFDRAQATTTVHCVKIKYCGGSCNNNITSEVSMNKTYQGLTKIVRKAFCPSGNGPFLNCIEQFDGCEVPSTQCEDDCPELPPDP